ncbi:MAG: peptide chain release factor 2 [Planctomycetes bacterium]|nr:peptide chain release factor 2 [Planctomycetota bacterium]
MSQELLSRIDAAARELDGLHRALKVDALLGRRTEIEQEMAAAGFWDDEDRAQRLVAELKRVKALGDPIVQASRDARDLVELVELAEGDPATLEEIARDVEGLQRRVEAIGLKAMLTGPHDYREAYVSVQPGSGGTESCDWAEMLLRMYSRYVERQGWSADLIDRQTGEEAGIKTATLHVKGPFAYGYLRSEAGVHRLVRISPFDAQKRRHTSFAAVDVVPALDDDIHVEIRDADLRVDTFRASGAGGQHVNRTDSAVRMTHLPTGVVVQCQNERSQHANRRRALLMLKAKLIRLEEERRQIEQARLYGEKGEIAWGNQIRSYVLQPYTQVKDRRTELAEPDVQRVLDGDLDEFIQAYLKWRIAGEDRGA